MKDTVGAIYKTGLDSTGKGTIALNANETQVVGTPLNKATFLPDHVAEQHGLDPDTALPKDVYAIDSEANNVWESKIEGLTGNFFSKVLKSISKTTGSTINPKFMQRGYIGQSTPANSVSSGGSVVFEVPFNSIPIILIQGVYAGSETNQMRVNWTPGGITATGFAYWAHGLNMSAAVWANAWWVAIDITQPVFSSKGGYAFASSSVILNSVAANEESTEEETEQQEEEDDDDL